MREEEIINYDQIKYLGDKIRKDLQDINLLRQTAHIDAQNFSFYNNYLLNRINTNIEKLIKEEQNND